VTLSNHHTIEQSMYGGFFFANILFRLCGKLRLEGFGNIHQVPLSFCITHKFIKMRIKTSPEERKEITLKKLEERKLALQTCITKHGPNHQITKWKQMQVNHLMLKVQHLTTYSLTHVNANSNSN